MKKCFIAVLTVLSMAWVSPAALIGLEGTFADGSSTFTYDGRTFQDNWAILVYESASSTIDFSFALSSLYQTAVDIGSGSLPFENFVIIATISMNLTDNIYIYPVLFDNAVPANSSNYLLLDTVARNVGEYTEQVSYTPGNAIPAAGAVQFNGQAWQPTAIPEPATLGLLGLGAVALVGRRRRRK